MIIGVDVPGITKSGEGTGGWCVYDEVTDKLMEYGSIIFPPGQPERWYFKRLHRLLTDLKRKWPTVHLVAIEHPFLYKIAIYIGALKMWIAMRRNVRWYMIGSSSARKTVFGSGKLEKEQVLRRIARRFHLRNLTQHQADAILYAIAAAKKTE